TSTCVPCTVQGRYLEQVQHDFAGRVAVEKIDAEVEAERASQFGIFTVPTTLIVDPAGRVRHINYGLTDARKLAHQIEDAAA
ncbi:MAG TPA: thioredoxin family protein, partial [Anaerolineae bacterium]